MKGFTRIARRLMLVFLALVASSTMFFSSPALAGLITLYEGNFGQQDIINVYPDTSFSGKVSPDDEARSIALNDVKPPTTITVYDDPSANELADFTTIKVKQQVPYNFVVPTLENSFENEYVKVEHHHQKGLDGKVSFIKIEN